MGHCWLGLYQGAVIKTHRSARPGGTATPASPPAFHVPIVVYRYGSLLVGLIRKQWSSDKRLIETASRGFRLCAFVAAMPCIARRAERRPPGEYSARATGSRRSGRVGSPPACVRKPNRCAASLAAPFLPGNKPTRSLWVFITAPWYWPARSASQPAMGSYAVGGWEGKRAGLAVAINEMLKRRSVAEWLRRGPVGRASWTPALQISTYCSQEFGTRGRRFIFSTL